MNIQHSSRTDQWYTPIWVIELVHQLLGTIDLDPASSIDANRRIKAHKIITDKAELTETPWLVAPGSVYCNPPGGKKGNRSLTGLFWRRLMEERSQGKITHAVFMCFSIEALQHTQNLNCLPIAHFPICIPRRRIAFDYPTGEKGEAPSHSNAIIYVPGTVDKKELFRQLFKEVGAILN